VTTVIVTHDARIAEQSTRVVSLLDGMVAGDVGG